MGKQQQKYEKEYKVEAAKLAKEIGVRKAARELGVPENTLYGWMKAAREGLLDMGAGSHTPNPAMSLAEELAVMRKQMKTLERENRRLKEENEFWRRPALFSRVCQDICVSKSKRNIQFRGIYRIDI